ncbi:MAG: HPr family phosphocarrier protein [Candidatus Pelethousia sp.]|nr:HPr family phosphocarrier protein [Candidatus Pelethousia sp.]
MKEFEYIITDEVGLHARPAGLLVKMVKPMTSSVILYANGKTADATKIIAIMSLGLKKGETVKVRLEGIQEEHESEQLRRFFAKIL